MQQFTLSYHALHCVVRVAMNFLIMLKVLASEGFDRGSAFSLFHDLFTRQRLARCRSVISAGGVFFISRLSAVFI